jgi:hypothetical protein
LELLGKLSGELQPNGARVAINIQDLTKIDIREFTDEQLNALYNRVRGNVEEMSNEEIVATLSEIALDEGFGAKAVLESILFDEQTMPPGSGGNSVCWMILEDDATRAAKNSGQILADRRFPPSKWSPYRDASPSDRFRMLQGAWRRLTGVELPAEVGMENLGAMVAIAVEFSFIDEPRFHVRSWPRVRLMVSKVPEPVLEAQS